MTTGRDSPRAARRAKQHDASRKGILDAARRVAERNGARKLSLRSVAAEAGFAPAALYGYFHDKEELMLALAADDLSHLARAMRAAAGRDATAGGLSAATAVALDLLANTETLAAAFAAIVPSVNASDAGRLLNGRLIAVLRELSAASGQPALSRRSQTDTVLMAAAIAGLAMLMRGGRLAALGFSVDELLARLDDRFSSAA